MRELDIIVKIFQDGNESDAYIDAVKFYTKLW